MRYPAPTRTEAPRRSVLVYDGECGICYAASAFVQRHASVPVDLVTFEGALERGWLATLTPEQIARSAHFITPDGVEFHGGGSMTRALRLVRGGAVFAVLDLPGISLLRDLGYALFAANRHRLSRVLRQDACRVDGPR